MVINIGSAKIIAPANARARPIRNSVLALCFFGVIFRLPALVYKNYSFHCTGAAKAMIHWLSFNERLYGAQYF
jgi:hypothetical protein